jgi:hypothetical protein
MKKTCMKKTAGGSLGMCCAAALVLILLGCEDPVTELRYVDREVSVPFGIRIETAADLAKIGIDPEFPVSGEYYLGEDIDLSVLNTGTAGEEEGGKPYVWRPIGSTCKECGGPLISSGANSTQSLPISCINEDCTLFGVSQRPFSGIFHGNGKKISGLVLSGGTEEDGYKGALYVGLFGYIQGAYIHDLTIELANTAEQRIGYTGESISDKPHIAVLAGFARNARIANITLQVKETGGLYVTAVATTTGTTYAGGAVGSAYDTTLTGITSSIPLDINGGGEQTAGGIAAALTTGEISNAEMTGNIRVESGTGLSVGGIGGTIGGTLKNCTVNLEAMTIQMARTTGVGGSVSVGGIAGSGDQIIDCTAEITTIKVDSTDTVARNIYMGGLAGSTSQGIENSRARFDTLQVTAEDTTPYMSIFVGGLVGNGSKISRSYIEGEAAISLNLPYTGTYSIQVGGLAGMGDVSRSYIQVPVTITITTGVTGPIYAGGLTGNGVAEYSYIGTSSKHAKLHITKTNTALLTGYTSNLVSAGGVSGQASITTDKPYQYNYSFCDIMLKTSGGGTTQPGQAAGGLVGYLPYPNGKVTECFAAGTVTITNNYAGGETTAIINAGGIAGLVPNGPYFPLNIEKCAALNGTVLINGSNTGSTVKWGRISPLDIIEDAQQITSYTNNITTISGTPPSGYTPVNAQESTDGLYKSGISSTDFLGTETDQLGWNSDVWKWDEVNGYPVLK